MEKEDLNVYRRKNGALYKNETFSSISQKIIMEKLIEEGVFSDRENSKPTSERIRDGEFNNVITREKIFDDKDKRKENFKITTIKDDKKKYYHISKKERDWKKSFFILQNNIFISS